MPYLIFFIYLVAFCWLLTRIPFFTKSGLTNKQLILFFLVKVAAGVTYGYLYTQVHDYKHKADTWQFFFSSKEETKLLLSHPLQYVKELFYSPYEKGYLHFFSGHHSWWNDLKSNVMIKMIALFNLFSFSGYYTNVIFYSFIIFFGPIAFIRTMDKIFNGKLLLIAIVTFLFPSFLYWCSGLHKDGIIFMALSVLFYHVYNATNNGWTIEKKIWVALCMLLILPLRNYIILALLPALLAWILSNKISRHKYMAFAIVYAVCSIFFFTSKYIIPKIDLPLSVALKQQEFFNLRGNSAIPSDTLQPSFSGFVKNAPQAIDHVFLRPYMTEIKSLFYLPAAVEVILILILLTLWIFFGNKKISSKVEILFLFALSIPLLLLVGYTVNFTGAIVRYRSVYIPFIIVPLICSIRWNLLSGIFNKNPAG